MNYTQAYSTSDKRLAHQLARYAIRALYFEVKAYPKPGLVSFVDSGAHRDMDGITFYRSLFTLRHYFFHLCQLANNNASIADLRETALHAEAQMLKKTNGVNTHRGAIFALGIVAVSAARLLKKTRQFKPQELQQQIINDWQNYLPTHPLDANSHGGQVRARYSIVDARQMALVAYEPVFQLLPSFINEFLASQCLNSMCLFAYLKLLQSVDDSTILYRCGEEGLQLARIKCCELLAIECSQTRYQQAEKLHQLFSQNNISPGGVADLLSVLLFLGHLFCEELRCHY